MSITDNNEILKVHIYLESNKIQDWNTDWHCYFNIINSWKSQDQNSLKIQININMKVSKHTQIL